MSRVIRAVTRPQGRRMRKQASCYLRTWEYAELVSRPVQGSRDFKQNGEFRSITKPLLKDATCVSPRYLDLRKPKSAERHFYIHNVLNVFDQHHSRKP